MSKTFRPRIDEVNKDKLLRFSGDSWNERVTNALSIASLSDGLKKRAENATDEVLNRSAEYSSKIDKMERIHRDALSNLQQVKQAAQQREESLKRVIVNSEEDLKQVTKERQDWKAATLLTLATLVSALVYFGLNA